MGSKLSALLLQRPLIVGMSLSALDVLGLLQEIFLEVMQHIQDIRILLMASEQLAAPSEFGH
jgi:hypothetical protein